MMMRRRRRRRRRRNIVASDSLGLLKPCMILISRLYWKTHHRRGYQFGLWIKMARSIQHEWMTQGVPSLYSRPGIPFIAGNSSQKSSWLPPIPTHETLRHLYRAPEEVENILVKSAIKCLGLGFRTEIDSGIKHVIEGEVELFLSHKGHKTPSHFDFQVSK